MRIWIVEAGEINEGVSVVHDGDRFLVFADDKYHDALLAFQKTVAERIGKGSAVYRYPGDIMGIDAKVHVIAQPNSSDGYESYGDRVELHPYEVIGG